MLKKEKYTGTVEVSWFDVMYLNIAFSYFKYSIRTEICTFFAYISV